MRPWRATEQGSRGDKTYWAGVSLRWATHVNERGGPLVCGEGAYEGGRRLTLGGYWESRQGPGCGWVRDGDRNRGTVREGEQRAQRRVHRADRRAHRARTLSRDTL